MYADDLLLMAISVSDLQSRPMIDLCVLEFEKIDLLINANKSICTRIGSWRLAFACKMVVHDNEMDWKSQLRYLGVTFTSSNLVGYNLQAARQKYFCSLNGIFGKLGTRSFRAVLLSLIDSFVFLYLPRAWTL